MQLGEILSAFEYVDRTAYDMALSHGLGPVLDANEVADAQCFILVETSGGNEDHDLAVGNRAITVLRLLKQPDLRNLTCSWNR